ncbi:MAG: TetR/AcrR family transcriptional regulator [Actinomycetaceae bacterium]|nr:TetR/AcrR family transcriptional regulator [Actinomycetaceae bacterium]
MTSDVSMLARPKRADVRKKILDSALEIFLSDGYEKASLSKIATHAGFTKGAIYSNFNSKQALLSSAWEEKIGNDAQEMSILLEEEFNKQQNINELLDVLSQKILLLIPSHMQWEIALNQLRYLGVKDKVLAQLYKKIYQSRIHNVVMLAKKHELVMKMKEEKIETFAIALLSLFNVICLEEAVQPGFSKQQNVFFLLRSCLEGVIR